MNDGSTRGSPGSQESAFLRRLAACEDTPPQTRQTDAAVPLDFPDPDAARLHRAAAVLQLLHRVDPGRRQPADDTAITNPDSRLAPGEEQLPDRIGRFRIDRQLGRGATGLVYLAWDEELGRAVAIKSLHALDADSAARFRGEGLALASLHHPHVVQVFEQGIHEGRPFLVMEYLPGDNLGLATRRRPQPDQTAARLVATIARAVAAAHAAGIVHRDLKPANVLLDADGVPKVSDFGLAKFTQTAIELTHPGMAMGTPGYMAPEQASGASHAVGPVTDVYGLGAVLYELLTGRAPFEGWIDFQVYHQVVHDEPLPVHRLAPGVARDLEAICLRCLEKQPNRRYPSAIALAEDLDRFLAGQPTRARPSGWPDRCWRWIRRHPLSASLALAAVLFLVVGSTLALTLAGWATSERNRARLAEAAAQADRDRAVAAERSAEEQAASTRAVSDFLLRDLLLLASPHHQANAGLTPRSDLSVREALDRAARDVGKRFDQRPLVEAEVRVALADAYLGLGEAPEATLHLQRAAALRSRLLGVDHPGTLAANKVLGLAHLGSGQASIAVPLLEDTLRRVQARLGADHPETLGVTSNLAAGRRALRQHKEALALFETTLGQRKKRLGPHHPDTLRSTNNLGLAYQAIGEHDQARRLFEQGLQLRIQHLGRTHPDTFTSMASLASALFVEGRLAEGLVHLELATRGRQTHLGPGHPDTVWYVCELAVAYRASGRGADAQALLRQAIQAVRAKARADPARLSRLMRTQGSLDFRAATLLRTVLIAQRQRLPVDAPEKGNIASMLGACLLALRQYPEAELVLREGLANRQRNAPDAWTTYHSRSLLGEALLRQKKDGEAEPLLLEGYQGMKDRTAQMPAQGRVPRLVEARQRLAQLYEARGDAERASRWRTQAKGTP